MISDQQARAALFQLTGVGVVETDLMTGRFLQVNKTFCGMVGYTEAELLTMTSAELTHPDDWRQDAQDFVAFGRGERREGKALTRYLRKDGRVAWLEVSDTVLGDGTEAVNLAVINDVTEREQTEAQPHDTLAHLQLATDAARAGWGFWDFPTGAARWDERGKKVIGFADDDEAATAQGWLGRVHPDDVAQVEAHVAECLAQDEDYNLGYRVVRADGQTRLVQATGRFTKAADGTPLTGTGLVIDVTEREEVEKTLRRAAERDAFRVELNDALSLLSDPLAVQEEAARVLAEHLQTDGVHYTEIDETQTLYRVARDFSRGDVPSMVGTYPVAAFAWLGPEFLAAGQIVVADARTSPLIPEADRAAVAGIGVRALVTVPLIKGGRFVAALSVVSATPRAWTPEEVERISDAAERTWATLEHAKAEAALRDLNETLEQRVAERTEALSVSEQRFAQAFYANPIPACMTSFGRETFVEVNDALLDLTGYARDEIVGHTSLELGMWSSGDDRKSLDKAQGDGKGFRSLELMLRTKDGNVKDILMSAEVIRLDGGEGYLKMFYDITERKQTEEQMHGAIQAVMNDASWFSRSLIEQLTRIRTGGKALPSVELSKRERQVLEHLANGANNEAIAQELGLSAQTVRNYISTIYSKLGVNSRVEAAVWARERGLTGK